MHEGHHGILDDLEDMDELFGTEKLDKDGNPVKKEDGGHHHGHEHKEEHKH